ncbi:peptidylprolyl cis-trans isomerase, PpiC-type [Geotalea daltonii FRC-32]|uniref:Peptidylprolyl cis-trans isomerase, PpiC-type n=1 Tax=Geotalea daltonii (strain DSM 22248 / JCM 15807 / FRC-32) TaxID=316067 RepID=B9M5S9_GEODF|nr:peptidylprolyl isomerase [Geotalea daltonii]ACM21838.1 peptidylprolyl cis-trans isomerase, PpiC-type [Geotalea daltonii FRC-32]
MSAKKISLVAALAVFAIQSMPALGAEPQKTAASAEQKEVKETVKKVSPSDPVAKINGTIITRKELDRAVKVLVAQNRLPQALPPEQQKQAEEAALDQLISAELMYQAGQKTEIKDIDKQIEEKIALNRAKFPNPEEFDKALKSVEMSEKDLKEFTRKDIVITAFIEKNIISNINVAEADAKKFYDDNTEKFKQDESIRASHILIGVDAKAGEEDKKKAREKAEGILKKIKAGEDFATLAKAESTCPSSKQGGDLGTFPKGQMVAPFENAAFALKPGEVSDVVETQFGYHIIKLAEKKEAGMVKFDEVKTKIVDYLKSQKIQKGVGDYLEELKSKAKTEKL